jgi:Uma2 family endonuclease
LQTNQSTQSRQSLQSLPPVVLQAFERSSIRDMSQTVTPQFGNKPVKSIQSTNASVAIKSEFLDGRVVARPAANRWHNLITTNFVVAIGSRVNRGSCEVYSNDMQVQIGRNSICFPDVVVVAGEPSFADESLEMLQNPTVVIEISSMLKSSSSTQKLEGFLAVPNIKECLLVNENEMRIEHYARQNAKQWIYRIYNERDDVINLDSINCKLSVSEVYAQVKLKDPGLSPHATG